MERELPAINWQTTFLKKKKKINWQTTDADACTSLAMTLQVKSPKTNFKMYY